LRFYSTHKSKVVGTSLFTDTDT